MHYLAIDTCVWIDLAKNPGEICEKILVLVERQKVRLILPQIVVDEWNRNRARIVSYRQDSISQKLKNARSLVTYLPEDRAKDFQQILEEFGEQKDQVVQKYADDDIDAIETLFRHPSTIRLEVTDGVRREVVDAGISRKAPFHKDKNNMADGAIIYSLIDYVGKEDLDNCVFVSTNWTDFCTKQDHSQIHEDLRTAFETHGMAYCPHIGKVINEIEKDLVSQETINELEDVIRMKELVDRLRERQLEAFRQMSEQSDQVRRRLIESQFSQAAAMTDMADQMRERQLEAFRQMSEQSDQVRRRLIESQFSQAEGAREAGDRWRESQNDMYRQVSEQSIRAVSQLSRYPLFQFQAAVESVTRWGSALTVSYGKWLADYQKSQEEALRKLVEGTGDARIIAEQAEIGEEEEGCHDENSVGDEDGEKPVS